MNHVLGRKPLGRVPLGGHWILGEGGGGAVAYSQPYRPGVFSVVVYNADGTQRGRFGSDMGDNPVIKLEFEQDENGCAGFTLTLGKLPGFPLDYGDRVDIHLFDDVQPWYSGYVISKPLAGSTSETYVYKGDGFVTQLKRILVNGSYENQDISVIVKNIIQTLVEPNTGILYRSSKIVPVGYVASRIEFAYTDANEAIKELAEFAANFVYGVDAYREFFFKPINTEINESARFTVGRHLSEYIPEESIDNIINRIHVRTSNTSEEASGILATVEDAGSQAAYGLREAVKTIPSALTEADATQWGQTQLIRYKDPVASATVKGVQLWYMTAAGTYSVRKLTPEGKARITSEDGSVSRDYPISKVKYSISSAGITCSLTLGDTSDHYEKIIVDLARRQKQAELMDQ
jgi:ribosomal protein L31E